MCDKSEVSSDEFRNGVKAMYDYLLYRTANNWHGNLDKNKICDQENDLINEWALDALEEVSAEDALEWRSITAAYQAGYKAGKQEG